MQMLVTGFLVSLALWSILVFIALQGGLFLHRGKVLADRWLLLVPYLMASLIFFGIRYRFLFWFFERQAVHEFFSIGAYWEADRIIFFICLPLFYVISVLRPQWVLRVWINIPLIIFLPFALKLFFYCTGILGWEANPAKIMPTRLD